jgi:large repetitive protein
MRRVLIGLFCAALVVGLASALPALGAPGPSAQVAKKCKKSKSAVAAKKKCKKKKGPATVPPTTTSPTAPTPPLDTDGDGVPDSSDNCVSVSNHDQADADGDGHGDTCDPCPNEANPGTAPCSATIYQISDGTFPPGSHVALTDALITAMMGDGSAIWVEVKSSDPGFAGFDYRGLEVGTSSVSLTGIQVGDRIDIDGITGTQSLTASSVALTGPLESIDYTGVTPANFAGGTMDAQLNGQFVDINGTTSVASIDVNGEWHTSDGFIVGKRIIGTLPACAVGTSLTFLFGIADIENSDLVLLPRSTDDLGQPCLTNLSVPATLCVGQTSLGSVTLSAPVPSGGGSMFVSLTSSDPTNVPVPSAVGVLEGQTTHNIGFTPTGPANNVTITATLNGGQTQAVTSAVNCP